MDAIETILNRKSIRNFVEKKIDEDTLITILKCGNQAPTARNDEPWKFIIIREKNNIEKLAEITDKGKFLKNADTAIAIISKKTKYYIEDCSAVVENILIAARNFNIGTCWIAGDKKPYCKEMLYYLNVPDDKYLFFAIVAMGYTNGEIKGREQTPLKEKLYYEKFKQ